MRITVDKKSSTPVYIQIYEQIRQQILSGEIIKGYRLPPERKFAETLGVNRSTVLNAYRELKSKGLAASHVGQGTIITAHTDSFDTPDCSIQEPFWNQLFSNYSNSVDSVAVNNLLMLANRTNVISFATGMASPESGPADALKGIEKELLEEKNYKALMYSPTEGFSSLREAICKIMRTRGIYCSLNEVMLLSGSQQGIDLAARVLLDPGDLVFVEEPSFFPAIQAFKSVGAKVIGIPVDDAGMKVDILEQLIQRYRPKLIYTMTNFHNPCGVEMDLQRRKKLIELVHRYKVPVLEDDAYGDLCYDGQPLSSLKSMDSEGYIIYLSTFSKSVYSGLRLGWLTAHKRVIQRFTAAKQIIDLHSSSLSQRIIERFILNGGLSRHIQKICFEYKEKRDIMCSSLSKHAPQGLSWDIPRGGYYIWCRLPEGVSASRLVTKAAAQNVVIVPGTLFYTSGEGDNFIRLNFTFASQSDISKGIKILCEALKEIIDENESFGYQSPLEISPVI